MTGVATARRRFSPEVVAAAIALDRISQARYGERLAEVHVRGETIDMRSFERGRRKGPQR